MFWLTIVVAIIASQAIGAEPTPLPKIGSCPSGYRMSGDYCVPNSDKSPNAFPRVGTSCPSGYRMSGDYCVSNK